MPEFTGLFDVGILREIQDAFAKAFDVACAITRADGTQVMEPSNMCKVCDLIHQTEEGLRACQRSDATLAQMAAEEGGPVVAPCLCVGFACAVAPIIVEGQHVASWFVGQFSTLDADRSRVERFARRTGADTKAMLEAFDEMRSRPVEELKNAITLMWHLAQALSQYAYKSVTLTEEASERKHAEGALKRANRALRAVSECNRALGRATDELDLLNDVCRIIVQTAGYRMAWVGCAEQDEAKTVRPVAQCGYEDGYLDAAHIVWSDTERGRGPTGTAIRTGKPQIVRRIPTDPHYAPWRPEALKRGYASSAALPLIGEEGALGVLHVYAAGQDALDAGEVELLMQLADDLAFGIDALRARRERDEMAARLKSSERMELVGQLAAGVAHEVRNPINAILAMTQALYEKLGADPQYRPHVDLVRAQTQRLSRLMRDLLDLSRPVHMNRLERVSVPAVCAAAIDLWQHSRRTTTHSVHLTQPAEANSIRVAADPARLEQVIVNLLENAAQHSPDGGDIELVIPEPEAATVRVRVIDRGPGIQSQDLPRIFEPFFTTRREGTGLGLSVVKHTVEAHGGQVVLWNNDPPPGCTAEVSLPLRGEGSAARSDGSLTRERQP